MFYNNKFKENFEISVLCIVPMASVIYNRLYIESLDLFLASAEQEGQLYIPYLF